MEFAFRGEQEEGNETRFSFFLFGFKIYEDKPSEWATGGSNRVQGTPWALMLEDHLEDGAFKVTAEGFAAGGGGGLG